MQKSSLIVVEGIDGLRERERKGLAMHTIFMNKDMNEYVWTSA